jgi:murein DD-endopeptidase MepM/ murein hydrolase activator NlpD
MDHDPTAQPSGDEHRCLDHQGRSFPFCFDAHDGTDFRIAAADTIDPDRGWVVAGAPGEVISLGSDPDHPCPPAATGCVEVVQDIERVTLSHAAGFSSIASHLESGSIVVEVGQFVERGQRLARAGGGSAGSERSVHFTIVDVDGVPVDPFVGPYSRRDGDSLGSLWCEQEDQDGYPSSSCH